MKRLAVVGNPENRRVGLFAAAVRRAGLPSPRVLSWLEVLTGNPKPFENHSLVRVEAAGENEEVDRILRGAAVALERGEIAGSAAWFAGFSAALARVEALAVGARLLSRPEDIRVMFDKAACHAKLAAARIAVPPALGSAPSGWDDLRSGCPWRRVFVKPRHGSSASGVVALEFGGAGRVQATTSVELAGGKLFNSLRVRRYRDERDIAAIVDRLAPDGLHVEKWYPKADLNGMVMDVRVVLVDGRATHAVGRGSRSSPMTNLHLGGCRIDAAAIRSAAGERGWREAMDSCERVAALFPGTLQMGVDLMFGLGWRGHAIAEVNAFGDLLPGLPGLPGLLADGRDTYDAQVAALLAKVPA
ncbi:MAG TPA: STM4014 family protein [Candidatus Limnocylindrales bacterium]|nr:STM4014 family protein [Candidatus Limnocylindrales bacterium]